MSFEFEKSTRHALRALHADAPTSHYSSLTVHSPKTYPYVLLSKNKIFYLYWLLDGKLVVTLTELWTNSLFL